MTGTLYLIPNTLGLNEDQQVNLLASIIPDTVQKMTAELSHFVARLFEIPGTGTSSTKSHAGNPDQRIEYQHSCASTGRLAAALTARP